MASRRLPDGKLVYIYCSSIFSGIKANTRNPKKVSQLLEENEECIKVLK